MNIPIRNLITMMPPKVRQQVIYAAWYALYVPEAPPEQSDLYGAIVSAVQDQSAREWKRAKTIKK